MAEAGKANVISQDYAVNCHLKRDYVCLAGNLTEKIQKCQDSEYTSRPGWRTNSLENGSQNSSGGSSADMAMKKSRGPKVVKSRYMQCNKPKITKKNNVENTSILSAEKRQEKGGSGTPTRRSVVPQRFKVPPAPPNVADGSFFCKENLQSTLLDGHKIARPEFNFSAIDDKTMQKLNRRSPSTSEQRKPKKEAPSTSNLPEDIIDMYESQTLLFTYLTIKMQKNMKLLEEKAERSLLLVHDEKTQLQERVDQLKRELFLIKREEQLNDVLVKQTESLSPSTAATMHFKDNYTSFATALDSTRHQLPIKDIHIAGTRQRFLEDIQKHLSSTISLLEEAPPSSANESMDLLDTIKNLEDIVHKTDSELSRSLHQVLDLSCKVNKEVSLQSQKQVEEDSEMEVVRQWYFDQAND